MIDAHRLARHIPTHMLSRCRRSDGGVHASIDTEIATRPRTPAQYAATANNEIVHSHGHDWAIRGLSVGRGVMIGFTVHGAATHWASLRRKSRHTAPPLC